MDNFRENFLAYLNLNKKAKRLKKSWKSFCLAFFHKKNLVRDGIVFAIAAAILSFFLFENYEHQKEKQKQEKLAAFWAQEESQRLAEAKLIKQNETEVNRAQFAVDVENWIPYQNTWYGFILKYPDNWPDPVVLKPPAGVLWEQKVFFKINQSKAENPFEGFEVIVYNIAKVKELSNTEEFPKIKSAEMAKAIECESMVEYLFEAGDYPAEKIYVPADDDCFNAALFFSNTRGPYIYNIYPKMKEGMGLAGDPAQELAEHMPEFFSIASTWNLIDIVRPKLSLAKPKITAPRPLAETKKDSHGRMICAKKNDKPSKSKQNKSKHLDMECCLDPDEYPNPHCYYPPEKYGKYLR